MSSNQCKLTRNTSAVTQTADLLCGVGPRDGKAISIAAQTTADAYSYAVADAAGRCPEQGFNPLSFTGVPPDPVPVAAEVWLEEYIERVSQELTCEPCEHFDSAWDAVRQTVFLDTLEPLNPGVVSF